MPDLAMPHQASAGLFFRIRMPLCKLPFRFFIQTQMLLLLLLLLLLELLRELLLLVR